MYIRTSTKSLIIMISVVTMLIMDMGCSRHSFLPDVNDVPIRNPFRSGLRQKVGPLPKLATKPSKAPAKVKWVWSNRLTFLSEGLSLYPKILPVIDEQWLYRADHKGHVVAIDKTTGKTRWKITIPHAISAGPSIGKENVYLTTQDAKLIALNKNTGKTQWAVDIPSEALAPAVENEKLLVVNTIDGKITGLNPKNGELLWTYECMLPQLTLRGATAPMIIDDIVITGSASGKLIALQSESGMLLWDKVISAPKGRSDLQRMVDIRADILRDGDSILVATFQGNLVKLSLSSGDIQWQKEMSVYHTLAMDDNAVYLTDANYHIWALDKTTGETLWEQDNLAERYIGAPVIIKDELVVGDKGGYLHWLNKDTGQMKANYFVGNKIVSDLIVDKKRIYVSTQNGKLSVFKVIN